MRQAKLRDVDGHLIVTLSDLGATDTGYFHMLRSTNLRFFNNMAVVAKTDEERVEALKSIGNIFKSDDDAD